MSTSFHHDFNFSPDNHHICDDEEMALQLQAEELAFQSVCGNTEIEGTMCTELPQTGAMANTTGRDLELARMLQVRDDEQSMRDCTTEGSRTDMEMAKMLQVDADEEMVADCATHDKKSDLELAMLLQQQEDIAASDFLIAKQLQDELEQEGAKRCQRCGQQTCQCHQYSALGHQGRRRRRAEEAYNRDPNNRASRGSTLHRLLEAAFPQTRMEVEGDQFYEHTDNDSDDDDYESLLELGETIGEVKRQGLVQAEMDELPTCRFNSNSNSTSTSHAENDSDSNNCRICFCAFSDNDVLRTLPCLHRYHRDCIDQWIQRKAMCPICRVGIKEHIAGSSSR